MKPFERLKYIRERLNKTQEEFGEPLGLKRLNITNLESGKVKISTLHALAIEHIYKVNKEWLLYGKGSVFIDDKKGLPSEASNLTKVIIQHQNIIKRFKDPKMAKEINEDLIELEDLDDNLYIDVVKHIKSSVNAARVIKGGEKNHAKGSFEKKRANGR